MIHSARVSGKTSGTLLCRSLPTPKSPPLKGRGLHAVNGEGFFLALCLAVPTTPARAQAPVADFSPGTQQVGTVPLVVNFTDLSTNSPTGWVWHFGDGAIDTVQNPSHTYKQTGIYTVSLQASNGGGSDITVKQALVWAKAERVINLPASVDLNVTPGSENAKTTRIYSDNWADNSGVSVSSGAIAYIVK